MHNALKKFVVSIIVAALILSRSVAQVRKRSVCGKVISSASAVVARTEASLYFGDDALVHGAATNRDGTFCIETYVSDLGKSTSAKLYVTSFCRSDDVTLLNVPFWPRLGRKPAFSGNPIIVGPGSVTSLGDVDVQVMYGHITLRILDRQLRPLLKERKDWYPVWIRVRDQDGVAVHESGLSVVEIERAVDLKESRINLALPQGKWTLEIALAGVPPDTGAIRGAVRWVKVPGKLKIESCGKPMGVAVSVSRPTRS